MLDHQKSVIVRKRKPSVAEREKSHVVVKKKRTISTPVKKIASASSEYLNSELGSLRHEILKGAKWKYTKGSEDVFAIYKKGDVRIWIKGDGAWYYKNGNRTYKVEWATILIKFIKSKST
jgi:hypothetical protein